MHFTPPKANFIVIYLIVAANGVSSLRVSGEWSTDKVYTFVARFAFQKTSVDEIDATRGYIFGNVTSLDSFFSMLKFFSVLVVDFLFSLIY